MSLEITVGVLADAKEHDQDGLEFFQNQFAVLNQLLVSNNLPQHAEPTNVPAFNCGMYGYSGLHYLRRIAAYLLVHKEVAPPCMDEPTEDPVFIEVYDEIATLQDGRSYHWKQFDHLLCHSDAEGFYVPIEFDEVLHDDDDLGVIGWQVGSSQRLFSECIMLAAALGMPTDLDINDERLTQAVNNQGRGTGWQRYGIETHTCARLIAAARHSVQYKAAIVFR